MVETRIEDGIILYLLRISGIREVLHNIKSAKYPLSMILKILTLVSYSLINSLREMELNGFVVDFNVFTGVYFRGLLQWSKM